MASDGKDGIMGFKIAIDGPAGAGKTTVARKVAEKLGFAYVDTGAMYRAMALYLDRKGIDVSDADMVRTECGNMDVSVTYDDGKQSVYVNGENVDALIRTEKIGNLASIIGTNPDVRGKMTKLQRDIAENMDVVMEGRDIGTCILPDTEVKIYLTADVSVRAERRRKELMEKGMPCDIGELEKAIRERDERDMNREVAPLVRAEDAILINSSNRTVDDIVDGIVKFALNFGAGMTGKGK